MSITTAAAISAPISAAPTVLAAHRGGVLLFPFQPPERLLFFLDLPPVVLPEVGVLGLVDDVVHEAREIAENYAGCPIPAAG